MICGRKYAMSSRSSTFAFVFSRLLCHSMFTSSCSYRTYSISRMFSIESTSSVFFILKVMIS